MPALVYLGRRWGIGADEFALPSLCSMALRVVWSIALVIVLFEVSGHLSSCSDGWLVNSYLICSLSTFALSVMVEWGITRVATSGSITDTAPRDSLNGYLSVHMLLGVVQVIMAGIGIALVTRYESACQGVLTDEALDILLLVVTCSQIIDVLVTCCCCMLMRGNAEDAPQSDGSEDQYEKFLSSEIEGQWESRCQCLYRVLVFLTCGLFGGGGTSEADFGQLARIMARIFQTEEFLDVVPSDIAAGIVLLYHKQRYQRQEVARQNSSPTTPPPSASDRTSSERGGGGGWQRSDREAVTDDEPGERASLKQRGAGEIGGAGGGSASSRVPRGVLARSLEHEDFFRVKERALVDVAIPADRQALEEIAHFSRYALAIYTWYLYVFERPCCGACDLLCYSCTGRARAFHVARSSRTLLSDEAEDDDPGLALGSGGGNSGDGAGHEPADDVESSAGYDGSEARRNRRRSSSRAAQTVRSPQGQSHKTWSRGPQGDGAAASAAAGANAGAGVAEASGSGSRGRRHSVHVSVRGDNWLGTHEAGLLRVAGLHTGCEVVDAQFASGITATPYCVLIDHAWRCVVVSIRGTMSLEDCLCDLQAEPRSMAAAGAKWGFDGGSMFAHQGVLGRAEWVREDLEAQGHLQRLLHGPPTLVSGAPRCRGYSLRITGHSLGGSTGVLLTYMLRRDYPSVRCISISPLGGLLNKPYADSCEDFVLSAAIGEDVVPRLSVTAMERMRDEVLELIARTKANKLTVMRSMVRTVSWPRPFGRRGSSGTPACRSFVGRGGRDEEEGCDLGGLVYSRSEQVPETPYAVQLARYQDWVDQQRAASGFVELLPAGRFVHYVKTHTQRRCFRTRWLYTPVWARPSDFQDIVVSKRMFLDHLPTMSCPRFTETYHCLVEEFEEASGHMDDIRDMSL